MPYECPHDDCEVTVTDLKNLGRHRRVVHNETLRRGRPKKDKRHHTRSDGVPLSTSHQQSELQCQLSSLSAPEPADSWWKREPWYEEIRHKQYHWNRKQLFERMVRLPRLGSPGISGKDSFVRTIPRGALPVVCQSDALRILGQRECSPQVGC